jgi:hypothetical protein
MGAVARKIIGGVMDATLFVLVLLALVIAFVDFDIAEEDDMNVLDARSNWEDSIQAWAVQ